MEIRVREILDEICSLSAGVFAGNLVGVYVHGSLAFHCFHWDGSDIDFIVVLASPPALRQKEAYMEGLLALRRKAPSKGLEMSVVLEQHTRRFVYPTPFALHFSNAHLQRCSENLKEYCLRMNGTDKDLAAHFTVIRQAGFAVCGKPKEEVFGTVPPCDYLDSIKSDIENAGEEIAQDPVGVTLNLCRVLAYVKDGRVLSKKDGGRWAVRRLPAQYGTMVESAVAHYLNGSPFPADAGGDLLAGFAEYMRRQISNM